MSLDDTAVELAPGLIRLRAPNPSPMTERGTNTYVVGESDLAIIDPGPALGAHLSAIVRLVRGRPVRAIVVTHSHLDHSGLAPELAEALGTPVLAFGDSLSGQSPAMRELAREGRITGGEGVDTAFRPDDRLGDGQSVHGDDWSLRTIHTPGHMSNHICLEWGDFLFTGDHVMGWASSIVSPPHGDLRQFMTSCRRLLKHDHRLFLPGHGAPVEDPKARLNWLIAHRQDRERQILAALAGGPLDGPGLVARVYDDLPAGLGGAALRNVLAHVIDLADRGLVRTEGPIGPGAIVRLSGADEV